MSGDYFAQIAQERSLQKQLMDQLEAENRELRKLLTDLRAGNGMAVTILGTQFSLKDNSSFPLPTTI